MKKLLVFVYAYMPLILLAAEEGEKAAKKSLISQVIGHAGFAGWATIIMSVFAFYLVIKLFLDTKHEKLLPPHIQISIEEALEDEDYEGAYAVVENDMSFLGRTIEGGLAKMNYGFEAIERSSDEAWSTEQTNFLQMASYVQLCGQLAPMMGLFGTVSGMMDAFAELARAEGAADPKELAEGIMNALVTTFIGLLVAIPVNFVYLLIRNKIIASGLEVGTVTTDLLSQLRGEEEE